MYGDEVSLKFYGFVIRYLFAVRENYFGDNIHFKTFEEYTSQEETQKTKVPMVLPHKSLIIGN